MQPGLHEPVMHETAMGSFLASQVLRSMLKPSAQYALAVTWYPSVRIVFIVGLQK